MITLYHVSFNLSEPLHKKFIVRIPVNIMNGEDNTIERICFSDSIQGCIRGIVGYPKVDEEYVDIIVWKHEFQEDDNLLDWKYLYENDLVPDAAVTHEYWYLKPIILDGVYYRISNIEYRTLYSFPAKFKSEILNILSLYVDTFNDFQDLDPCTIINEWVPNNIPLYEAEVIEQMKNKLCTSELRSEEDDWDGSFNENAVLFVSDSFVSENRFPEYDATDMLISYRIEKIG